MSKNIPSDMFTTIYTLFGIYGVIVSILIVIVLCWGYIRLKASIHSEYKEMEQQLKHNFDTKLREIDHEYNRRLEMHRVKLQHESELATVKLSKDLELKASERNIKLTEIFTDQAKTIVAVYQKLVELYQETHGSIIFRPRNPDDNQKSLNFLLQKRKEFDEYFTRHKIYLPPSTAAKIAQFEKEMSVTKHRYELNILEGAPKEPNVIKEKIEIHNQWFNEIPKLLTALEIDLQELLGFPKQRDNT